MLYLKTNVTDVALLSDFCVIRHGEVFTPIRAEPVEAHSTFDRLRVDGLLTQAIIPAATVLFVASSITMKLPVERFLL